MAGIRTVASAGGAVGVTASHTSRLALSCFRGYKIFMSAQEEEPHLITTDPSEVKAMYNMLYISGALDDTDIYEIVKPDGKKERLMLGGKLRPMASCILQDGYPDCTVILVSEGDVLGSDTL
jgi:hypothetical protein